jgi:hypothetical protein
VYGCSAIKQGFHLQDPEVDDVVRAARDLEAGCIEPDTGLSAEENVELLLRATRLLQLGLEVQFTEAEGLLSENNGLRDDLRVSEEQQQHEQWHRTGSHGLCIAQMSAPASGTTHSVLLGIFNMQHKQLLHLQ